MAQVRQLLDGENNITYPVTIASATYLNGGKYTVQEAIDNLQNANMKIKFPSSEQIIKELAGGDVVTTTFNADNTITEVTTNKDGSILQSKVTRFKEDGSIEIEVV